MIEAPPRPTDAEAPPGWSDAELATLATLADTLVPDGGTARATLAAAALELAVDPGQVRQLRLALRLLESRAANLLLTGRAVAFSQLEREARERYLLGWGRSRLALRRSAYQAFCRLLMFLAYADPGDGGEPNPRLVAMGYVRDDPGLTASPTPIRPFALPPAGDPQTPIVLEADVAIVARVRAAGSWPRPWPRPVGRWSCSRRDRW